ncbi:MAG: hypothetical protein QXP54_05815 [Thermofilum sp.]
MRSVVRSALGRRFLLAAAAAVAAAALLLLLGFYTPPAPLAPSSVALSARYLLVEVEGPGALLVNGSAQSLVSSAKPFTALVEAAPGRCSRLVELLVNGTPVESSRILLEVGGNTTVKAVFARYCVLVRFEVAGPGSVLVNGSAVANGSELEVEPGATLLVALEAAERFEKALYVNGTRLQGCSSCWAPVEVYPVAVRGDTELRAVFEPRRAVLHVDTGGLPVLISSGDWWQQVNGSATIGVEVGQVVNLTVFCKPDGDKLLCAVAWHVSESTPLGLVNATAPPNTTLVVRSDTWMRAVVLEVKGKPPEPARGAVLLDGREAPATMYPEPFSAEVRPWTASIQYLGGGEWLIDSPKQTSLLLELPRNWSTAALEIWVEYGYPGLQYLSVEVVVREHPTQDFKGCDSGGRRYEAGAYLRIILTRSGEVPEMPEGWGVNWGGWVVRNPLAKEGWLYLKIDATLLKLRISLKS